MALHGTADGCPEGLCNCGCSVNPCKPCDETNVARTSPTPPPIVAGAPAAWAWCITQPSGRLACWPFTDTIPQAALKAAFEWQTRNPEPRAITDRNAVDWPTQP